MSLGVSRADQFPTTGPQAHLVHFQLNVLRVNCPLNGFPVIPHGKSQAIANGHFIPVLGGHPVVYGPLEIKRGCPKQALPLFHTACLIRMRSSPLCATSTTDILFWLLCFSSALRLVRACFVIVQVDQYNSTIDVIDRDAPAKFGPPIPHEGVWVGCQRFFYVETSSVEGNCFVCCITVKSPVWKVWILLKLVAYL